MQKEELIQLHTLFAKIKNEMEKEHPESEGAFSEYNKLGVFPGHLHRSKDEYKRFSLLEKMRRLFLKNQGFYIC